MEKEQVKYGIVLRTVKYSGDKIRNGCKADHTSKWLQSA